jgi:hypothetical protein
MMMWTLLDAAVFAAGYAASIYSWPRIKLWTHGAESEIANLEARVVAIKAAATKTVAAKPPKVTTGAVAATAAATPAATTLAARTPASTAPAAKAAP